MLLWHESWNLLLYCGASDCVCLCVQACVMPYCSSSRACADEALKGVTDLLKDKRLVRHMMRGSHFVLMFVCVFGGGSHFAPDLVQNGHPLPPMLI